MRSSKDDLFNFTCYLSISMLSGALNCLTIFTDKHFYFQSRNCGKYDHQIVNNTKPVVMNVM